MINRTDRGAIKKNASSSIKTSSPKMLEMCCDLKQWIYVDEEVHAPSEGKTGDYLRRQFEKIKALSTQEECFNLLKYKKVKCISDM